MYVRTYSCRRIACTYLPRGGKILIKFLSDSVSRKTWGSSKKRISISGLIEQVPPKDFYFTLQNVKTKT